MRTGAAILIASLALGVGCKDSPTDALIKVDSEFANEITRIEVEIRDTNDLHVGERYVFDAQSQSKFRPPFSFRVLGRGAAPFVVRANAYKGDAFLAQAKLRVAFREGETVRKTVLLLAACRGVECGDGASCAATEGACGDIPGAPGPGSPDTEPEGGAGSSGTSGEAGSSGSSGEPKRGGSAADGGEVVRAGSGGAGREASAGSGGAETPEAGSGGAGRAAAGSGGAGRAAAGSGAGGRSGVGGRSGAPGSSGAGGGGTDEGAGGAGGNTGTISDSGGKVDVVHDGHNYVIQNNVYDPDASQTISYDETSFTVTNVTGQTVAVAGISMPSVYIGSSWYKATADSNLQKQVSAIQSIDVTFRHNAGSVAGVYNATHSTTYNIEDDPDVGKPSGGVLEVWYYIATDMLPVGNQIARQASIPGVDGKWDIWQGAINDNQRPCLTYVRVESLSSFAGDLKPFLDDAIARDVIKSTWYLTSVVTGFEIHSGGVGLQATDISSIVR